MLTVEALRAYGANVDEAMKRCMNNEMFYIRLVTKALQDPSFEQLSEAVCAGDLDRGFELAHALKGVTGNLALTPLYDPICKITELLRSRTETDYTGYLSTILEKKNELAGMI